MSRSVKFPSLQTGSLAAHFTGSVQGCQFMNYACYQLNWNGSPSGTLKVQGSSDYSLDAGGNVKNAGSWATITSAQISGSYTEPTILNLTDLAVPFVRPVFTFVTGNGTGSLYFSGKGI